MSFDFQNSRNPVPGRPSRRRWWLAAAIALAAGLLWAAPALYEALAPAPPPPPVAPPVPEIRQNVARGSIVSGETLSTLFARIVPPDDVHGLVEQVRPHFQPRDLCAGNPYRVCTVGDNFSRFEYDINRDEQLIIARDNGRYRVSRAAIPYEVKVERVRGVITSSLFEAVASLGEEDRLALLLADIFAYDVDFILDIRAGDSFQALVEKRYRDGRPAGYARVLAAEFTNQGQTYQAIRYRDGSRAEGWYAPDGQSRRQQFLRAPLEFSRISSGFTMRRLHPVLNTWRAHPAIDYAAPAGTPVRSVGDGTVLAAGFQGGGGNTVKIRHANGYVTMYLHLSRFGKGIRPGVRVAQGQVIGQVGSTGLSTGPHLDFRMTLNGAPINPARVRSIAAEPVSRANLADFRAHAGQLLARLAEPAVRTAAALPDTPAQRN